MTVTVYLAWKALVLLLISPYFLAIAALGASQIGSGPRYSARENVCGTIAVLSALVCLALYVWAGLIFTGAA